MVPARVSVPDGLSMTRLGSCPAVAVALPGKGWGAAPARRRRAAPRGVGVPAVGVRAPLVVRVVPAATLVEARKSTALRVWLPVMVPPAKITVLVPASRVPAV